MYRFCSILTHKVGEYSDRLLVHLASDIKSIRRQVDYNDYSALHGAASRICDALELSQTCGVPTLDQADKTTSEHELPSPAILAQRLIMSWKWKQLKYQ
jgi:hypothetical protein